MVLGVRRGIVLVPRGATAAAAPVYRRRMGQPAWPAVAPWARPGALLAAVFVAGCARDFVARPDASAARLGMAPEAFRSEIACTEWRRAVDYDRDASSHTTFPELAPTKSCYVEVAHDDRGARPGATPAGCAFPSDVARSRDRLKARAALYERIAAGDTRILPLELACGLAAGTRAAAAAHNARTLRSLATLPEARAFPYGAASTFGYGERAQDRSALVGTLPGAACVPLSEPELARLGVNVERARRVASAYHGGVAPVVTVSGGAVHSRLVEAFALEHLVRCRHGVPAERVLVDPCADHTHTNLRNTGALVIGIGARVGYVVTDSALQSDYLGDFTLFDAIGGSVDQRSLRDFGGLLGAWRRASRGVLGGFWYTPYRFWADPGPSRDLACVGDVPSP